MKKCLASSSCVVRLLETPVDPAAVVVDRVVPAPQDPAVARQPVVVEHVRRVADPLPVLPADRRPAARPRAARSSARSRRPARSSAAAGSAATGTRWCRAAPAARGPRPCGVRRCTAPVVPSSRRRLRALVDPHARRRARPGAAPTPAGPARPWRCVSGSHSPARYVGESTSARTAASSSRTTSCPAAGRATAAGSASSSAWCGALATLSSPVSSQAQSMPWRRTMSRDAAQVLGAQPVEDGDLRRPALDAVGVAVGQAGGREAAVAAAGLVAAVPGLQQHHVDATGRAPWRAGRPTAPCSRRRPRPGPRDSGPRSAGSGSGRAGSSSQKTDGAASTSGGVHAQAGRRRWSSAAAEHQQRARPGTSPCRPR